MTLISNSPIWWPVINSSRVVSYFMVAGSTGVIYDLVLTLGQEVELIWMQPWSLMSILYLSVRYLGIVFSIIQILGHFMYNAIICMTLAVNVMLGAITTARLYAMYQRSRKMLVFLVVTLLTVNISNGVLLAIGMGRASEEVFISFGTYQCTVSYDGDVQILKAMPWILSMAWEILALCLASWIAVNHFRELQRHSAGGIIGDFVTVLMKSHLIYFSSFVVVSLFWLGDVSPTFTTDLISLKSEIYRGFLQIILVVQMFVVGPRLILSLRRYRAELVACPSSGTGMISIALQERGHESTVSTSSV
ncbi:hypothetical protein BDR03DRAFT_1012985 [Suillus americanus]|nr:hypothetical protein BDR03DRAFT_1012985 [Suillus americanus]